MHLFIIKTLSFDLKILIFQVQVFIEIQFIVLGEIKSELGNTYNFFKAKNDIYESIFYRSLTLLF